MIEPKNVFQFQAISYNPEEKTAECLLKILPDNPYFQGHFPDKLVLPGVAILDASIEFIRRNFGVHSLQSIKAAKFMGVLEPGMEISLHVRKEKGDEWRVEWRDNGSKILTELILRF